MKKTLLIFATSLASSISHAQVGIGTTTPKAPLHVVQGSTSGSTVTFSRFSTRDYPVLTLEKAEGTFLEPTAVQKNISGAINFMPYGVGGYNQGSRIVAKTTQPQTAENGGSSLEFQVTNTNTNTASTVLKIEDGKVNIGGGGAAPARVLEVNAASAPIRLTNLSSVNNSVDVLAIDASGDVTRIPYNNLNAVENSFVTTSKSYKATGNESYIWVTAPNLTITLPTPTPGQVGKQMNITAAGGAVKIINGPTWRNSSVISNLPAKSRMTINAIPKGPWGSIEPTWVLSAKDFTP